LLADEINRATPKTQSALLEAMEERQVTVEGKTRRLKDPFYVIATQNPFEQSGTFPLPESQLDRFLMRISLGYPGRDAEKTLLRKGDVQQSLSDLGPSLTNGDVMRIQEQIAQVHAADTLLDYVEDLLLFSRSAPDFALGLSPRAGLSILRAARSWAFLWGRDYVLPEDVQKVLPWVVGHRLRAKEDYREFSHENLLKIMLQVPVPT